MTICVKCRFFDQKGTGVWYNQFCVVQKQQVSRNPVTGESEYLTKNGVGTTEAYPHCRDKNTGNCKDFASTGE